MCGISGLVNCGDRETLARMTHIQAHRGPDDFGLWEHKFSDGSYVGVGSRRLAILDLLAGGHLLMCDEDQGVWITYNSEIYKLRALRRVLGARDRQFPSEADLDVLVHRCEA